MQLALMAMVGFGLFILGMYKVRAAVVGALLLAVFEGVFRKWIVPESGQLVYFAKDVLLLGGYVGVFGPRIVRGEPVCDRHPANLVLVPLLVLGICELANPALANMKVGLFGIKAYLLDVPLLYLVPRALGDVRQLRGFWIMFLAVAAIPVALGILQFSAPVDSEINRYAWEEDVQSDESVAVFAGTDRVRITGTFSYVSGYTVYLSVVVLMSVSLVLSEQKRWIVIGAYGVLILGLANMLMTGSRGPVLTLIGAMAVLAVLSFRQGVPSGAWLLLVMLGLLPAAVIAVEYAFPDAWTSFAERAAESDDLEERLANITASPVSAADVSGMFGYGIGSTHQAASFLIPDGAPYKRPPDAEGEWERIVLELGPLGLALVVVVRILVAWKIGMAFANSRDPAHRWFLAMALSFAVVSIPGNLVFNHTASVFYWFFAGVGLVPDRSHVVVESRNVRTRLRSSLGTSDWRKA